ncbi:MAG: hypothetical protein MJ230_06805 [bacterium]|nr:hypothetical protein [bacterium]
MAISSNYQNEYVEYQGQKVKVLEQNHAKRTITIEYNGEIITVNFNDIFGINNNDCDTESTDSASRHINFLKDRIKNLKERIKFYCELFSNLLENIKDIRHKMLKFLGNHDVDDYKKLTSQKDRDTYLAMLNESNNCKKDKNSALCWILSDSNDCLTDCCYLNKWESMQALT